MVGLEARVKRYVVGGVDEGRQGQVVRLPEAQLVWLRLVVALRLLRVFRRRVVGLVRPLLEPLLLDQE